MVIEELKVEYICKKCGRRFISTHYNADYNLMLIYKELGLKICTECNRYTMIPTHIRCIPKDELLKQLKKIDKSLKPYSIIYQCVRCYNKWSILMHLNRGELSMYDMPDPPGASRNVKCISESCSSQFSRVIEIIPL